MHNQIKHKPIQCMCSGCDYEASKWIDIGDKTFYLCSDCASKAYNDNEEIVSLNTITGELITYEVAEYSCHEDCATCNQ